MSLLHITVVPKHKKPLSLKSLIQDKSYASHHFFISTASCQTPTNVFQSAFPPKTHIWGNRPRLSNSIDSIYIDFMEHVMKTAKNHQRYQAFAEHLLVVFSFLLAPRFSNLDRFITVPAQLSHCREAARRPWGRVRRRSASEINLDGVILQSVRV